MQQIYIMERNVRHYDIRDPFQALQFVSVLPRLARHGLRLRCLLEKRLEIIHVNQVHPRLWSKLPQREDERSAAARTKLEQGAAQEVVQKGSRDIRCSTFNQETQELICRTDVSPHRNVPLLTLKSTTLPYLKHNHTLKLK